MTSTRLLVIVGALGTMVGGCAGQEGGTGRGSGGSGGSGGMSSPGGRGGSTPSTGTGGATSTGGAPSTGSGGVTSTGGTLGTGGQSGTSAGSGGVTSTGGTLGTGGQSGTSTGSGGVTGTGGRLGTGGQSGTGGAAATDGGAGAAGAGRSVGCGKTPTITTGSAKQIMVGGTARTYNIQIPAGYDNNNPYRLIVGYHGASQSANTVTGESYFGLLHVADGNTIFVAPQGLGDAWPNTGGADVTFSRQLVMELEDALCIDTTRIFAEGFSMGGAMAYSMACSASDIVRAVAVHSGCPITACAQQHNTPVAYFMTHGTADQICAYPRYGVPLLQDFAKVNGCTMPDPNLDATGFAAALPHPTSVNSACIEFTGCKPGYPTRSCLFVGPHEWNPGNPTWVPAEVWTFFKQF